MLSFILKNGKRMELQKYGDSLNAKLYTEDGVFMGEIDWDSNTIAEILFTE